MAQTAFQQKTAEIKKALSALELHMKQSGVAKVDKHVWETLWDLAWTTGCLHESEEGQRIISALFTIHASSRTATPDMVWLAINLLNRSIA